MYATRLLRPSRQSAWASVRYASRKTPQPPKSDTSARPSAAPSSATNTPPPSSSPSEPSGSASPNDATAPPPPTQTLSLDFSPVAEEPAQERGRTGARSSENSMSSIEKRRRFLGRVALGVLVAASGLAVYDMGRDWEEEELKKRKLTIENAPSTRFGRTKSRFSEFFNYFVEPVWSELLPPPIPQQKPYTLLISIDDLLVTSTWDRQKGWRTAKRPGVDYFIGYLSQFYEIVIFTTQNNYTAEPITIALDPYNFYISHRLYREATRRVDGKTVKDLSYLNRDLSKVVLLDAHEEHVSTHPENSIVIPKWTGDPKDRGLIAMIPFLESLAIYKTPDVRPVINAYKDKNIPIEYAKKETEAKEKFLEEWRSGSGLAQGGFTLSKLFGGPTAPQSGPEPLTYLEQKRREAQWQYREEQEFIRKNKAELDREQEEMKKAAAREMPANLWGALGALSGAPPPQPGQEQTQGGASAPAGAVAAVPSTPSSASA